MLRFRITEEALIDVFGGNGIPVKCVEGLPHPSEIVLKDVHFSPTGVLTFNFDDGKLDITDAAVRFESARTGEE